MGTYEGWSNQPTWNVNLWLNNDRGAYHDMLDMAQQHRHDTRKLADTIESYVEDMNPLGSKASLFSDLLTHALNTVDWYEIAESWIIDLDPEPKDYPLCDNEQSDANDLTCLHDHGMCHDCHTRWQNGEITINGDFQFEPIP